jgi:peroxiredoxin|tara:strand:+ start:528 stop:725 length:198 start_codon:yes stop_codon:yes gene_type:complete
VEKYIGWGIDLEGDSGEDHHLLPHPSVFVVDRAGVIKFAHVDANYKTRLSTDEVLAAVKTVSGNE